MINSKVTYKSKTNKRYMNYVYILVTISLSLTTLVMMAQSI